MKRASDTHRELLSKKSKAYFLIVVKGYDQKEAAKLIGISENSMSIWAKKHNWRNKAEANLVKKGGMVALMEGFIEFVNKENPLLKNDVDALWKKYLKKLEGE